MPLLPACAACRVKQMTRSTTARQRTAALSSLLAAALVVSSASCRANERRYELKGQVVAVDQAGQILTIKHDDIPGFMPGMTMPFKVADARWMNGRTPGELVTATLIVTGSEARLADVARAGFAAIADPTPPPAMNVIQPGQPVVDAALVDETGAGRGITDWHGRILAVTFIYTTCPLPDFCPLIDRRFKDVQERLRTDGDLRDQIQLLSVSFDPEGDKPAVLARHAAALGADPAVWHFLTGERAEVEAFASQFGVSIAREGQPAGQIVHNLRTAIVDAEGKLIKILNGSEWTAADLMAEFRRARAKR